MFHLPCGETTVTLQDVVMILGLPIDDTPISSTVSPGRWRDSARATIGLQPPGVPAPAQEEEADNDMTQPRPSVPKHRQNELN
jgi:hypothetical protein